MKIKQLLILFPLFVLFDLIFFVQVGLAQSINYQTYKYGSHQTSMAAGYYVRPAQITVSGNKYLVTMTIRTKKSLSPYPVKVLTIDGKPPLNVVKTRHGSNYDYRYGFKTNDLRHDITSKISIDVPGIYKAVHNITFSFSTNNLPKLKASHSSVTKVENQSNTLSTSKPDINQAALIREAKIQFEHNQHLKKKLALAQLAQNKRNQCENEHNQKMFYYMILICVLSTLVLIIAAVGFILSIRIYRKSKG